MSEMIDESHEENIHRSDDDIVSFMKHPNTQLIWSCCAPIEELTHLVYDQGASLSYREPLSGNSALHAAAELGGEEQVRWYLGNGAAWNLLDNFDRTPAEIALEEGHKTIYDIIFWHAVDQEWKRHYEPHVEQEDDPWITQVNRKDREESNKVFMKTRVWYTDPRQHIDPSLDSFSMIDQTGTAVMSEWERPIMEKTAQVLFEGMKPGTTCLNIGFGLGIIDTYFQSFAPSHHTIIEAHPDALAYMRKTGWYDKPNVRILEGRWQDFIGPGSSSTDADSPHAESAAGLSATKYAKAHGIGRFDVVYFDTYEEGYTGYMKFWKCVPGLLRGPGSRLSFFHGIERGREFTYKVYSEVARLHLNDLGLDTVWHYANVDANKVWYTVDKVLSRKPGQERVLETHPWQIPVCTLAPTIPRKDIKGCGWASSDKFVGSAP